MKTAKEMFKELGYELESDYDGFRYVRREHGFILTTKFNQYLKNVEIKHTDIFESPIIHLLTMPELQAIHTQCEELGWFE